MSLHKLYTMLLLTQRSPLQADVYSIVDDITHKIQINYLSVADHVTLFAFARCTPSVIRQADATSRPRAP